MGTQLFEDQAETEAPAFHTLQRRDVHLVPEVGPTRHEWAGRWLSLLAWDVLCQRLRKL